MIPLIVIAVLLALNLQGSEGHVGVCYKTPGKNQPPPTEAVALLEKHNLKQIRLYEPNHEVLKALKGKDIDVLLGIPNLDVITLSTDPAKAELWVQTYVKAYSPDVKIKYIVVGNEISTNNENSALSFFLLDAITNFQKALSKVNLKDIKLTTTFDTSILRHPYSDVPSNITFAPEAVDFLQHVLKHLTDSCAPFMVNMYPYYGHILNPKGITLDSALFNGSNGSLLDMVDSIYSALEKIGYKSIDVVVAETGWPSEGGDSTSVENQKTYITKLIEQVKKGTPMKPNKTIETYLYSMFDEDAKGAPAVESHWGLFTPTKELKFQFSGALNPIA